MTDFHRNVFYYYRGPRAEGGRYDFQLEDNTTKALINTLMHTGPEVANRFLAWLNIPASGGAHAELQRKTIGKHAIGRTSHRLLLGLVERLADGADIAADLSSISNRESRPDAWIYGDDYVVLIESKVGDGQLAATQTQQHLRKLAWGASSAPRFEQRTWASVHRFFKCITPEFEEGSKDKWLIKQFTQYLEWNGMCDFAGFEDEAFDFFLREEGARSEETKRLIRGVMQAFGDRVLVGIRPLDPNLYRVAHLGDIESRDDHCWVAIVPGHQGFGNVAHQTVALYGDRIDVFANVELNPAINRLTTRMDEDPARFREVVSALPHPFTLQIEERKQRQAQKFDYFCIARLEGTCDTRYGPMGLKHANSCSFAYARTLLENIKYPYFSVRKTIPRHEALRLSEEFPQSLVDRVVAIMKAFHEFVRFVNGQVA